MIQRIINIRKRQLFVILQSTVLIVVLGLSGTIIIVWQGCKPRPEKTAPPAANLNYDPAPLRNNLKTVTRKKSQSRLANA